MPFRTELTVRFGDVDPAGFVYYPRLVHYCHVAMEDVFSERLGLAYATYLEEHGLGLPTVHLEADYHRPMHYGDRIAIEVTIERLGETSIVWRYRLLRGGEEPAAAEMRIVTVNMDMSTHTKRPIPDWLRGKLTF